MSYYLPFVIPDPVPYDDPDLLIDKEVGIFLYKGRKLSKKRRFELMCKCGKKFITTQNYLANKQYKFICRSCSCIEAWKKDSYRDPRQNALREECKSEAGRERSRIFFTKKWEESSWREKILINLRSEKVRKNISNAIRGKLLSDEEFRSSLLERRAKYYWGEHCDYQRPDQTSVHLKSRGEKRFAQILDRFKFEWEYEKRGFKLLETGELYFPDFYVADLDLWIEVKYTLRERDLRKFRILENESKDIKLLAIGFKNINHLEKVCESQKLKQDLLELYEISRSSKITTS